MFQSAPQREAAGNELKLAAKLVMNSFQSAPQREAAGNIVSDVLFF